MPGAGVRIVKKKPNITNFALAILVGRPKHVI